MDQKNNWLSISELAQICGISRQTLIYYDKHDIYSSPDISTRKVIATIPSISFRF